MSEVIIRPARTADVKAIHDIVAMYSPSGRLLAKNPVTLYEDVQEFSVAEVDGKIAGCGALHVMWSDLGEVRTVAVLPEFKGKGIGGKLLRVLEDRARELGLKRLFCLTFETEFFGSHGFNAIDEAPVDATLYAQLLQSGDEGVAEFLDLERVKPNTLGNTRMLKIF